MSSKMPSDSVRNDSKNGDVFDPYDTKAVDHRKIGVWDLYVQRSKVMSYFPTSWKAERYFWIWDDVPYLWRAMCDMRTVAWPLLSLYLVLTLIDSLLPALSLWYMDFSSL
jgi:hypothetical protein